MDGKFRWKTYGTYKLILWAWMMSEVTMVFSPIEMSHNGFYLQSILYVLSAIFVGIPLVYSEICIAQYTNCNAISMWNFFPIMRCVGYGTVLLMVYKVIYLIVLSSWYLNYAFYAALDPPPWFSCEEFNNTKCMVKRVNTSIFQHCIETQVLFNDDCGMKTASYLFFDHTIGKNNTVSGNCSFQWKSIIICFSLSCLLFLLFLKKDKFIRIAIKMLIVYICFATFVLFCVALSASGAWYASKINLNFSEFDSNSCATTSTHGFLSLGTGYGMIGFLTQGVPFRSPATMTSIAISLFSVFFSVLFSLIIYSGIKSMSYFHGEEAYVLEIGNNIFFPIFASTSEITSYFDERSIWSFLWFSAIFLCLFTNMGISLYYLHDLFINNVSFAKRYKNLSYAIVIIFLCIISCPLFCSDLLAAFSDATEIIQILNSILFSIAVYWIYGYKNHKVDILFMIGVKASYFWKIASCLNPVFLAVMLYIRLRKTNVELYDNSFIITTLGLHCDVFLIYILLSLYVVVIFLGLIYECRNIRQWSKLQSLLYPTKQWGPQDLVLQRSRKMFVPEIMTREFLYRQVRIHGYLKNIEGKQSEDTFNKSCSESTEKIEWSALTSN